VTLNRSQIVVKIKNIGLSLFLLTLLVACTQKSNDFTGNAGNQELEEIEVVYYPAQLADALFTDIDFKNINSNFENESGNEYIIDKKNMSTQDYSENKSGFGFGWGAVEQHIPEFCEEYNISMGTTKSFINSKNIHGALVKFAGIGDIPRTKKANNVVFTAIAQQIFVFSNSSDASKYFTSIENSSKECAGSAKIVIEKSGEVMSTDAISFVSKNLKFYKDKNLTLRSSTDESKIVTNLRINVLNGSTVSIYEIFINNYNNNVKKIGWAVFNDLLNKQNKTLTLLQGSEDINYDLTKLSSYEPDIELYEKFLYEADKISSIK
jgi:hypothetical protein